MSTPDPRPTPHHHTGSCHCGHVRYAVEVDLHEVGTTQCNCSWCRKHGWWAFIVKPAAFRAPLDAAPQDASSPHIDGVRCPHCHVLVYSTGDMPELGGAFVSINVRTLDDVDLREVPVVGLDGRADTWDVLGRWCVSHDRGLVRESP